METASKSNERENESHENSLSTLNYAQESHEKNLLKSTICKHKFYGEEQYSQEENCAPAEDLSSDTPVAMNGHSLFLDENGYNSTLFPSCNKPCFNQNNNLVVEKSNLRSSDEKSLCFYAKFPLKVNNNSYQEKPRSIKDGMEDYFQRHSFVNSQNKYNGSDDRVIESPISDVNDQFYTNEMVYPDQINGLNCEEEDEDNGCIYTYKGDNYEENLSHLLQTCFSCGLPASSELVGAQRGAVSIQRMWNGSHPNPNPPSNLYSPDMDFLEMDFDPGSTGEGGDSDCEDNSVLNTENKPIEENSLENFSRFDLKDSKQSNNIPSEIKKLICRRCEICVSNEQKVNNVSNNFTQKLNCESAEVTNVTHLHDIGIDEPHIPLADEVTTPSTSYHIENNLNLDDRPLKGEFSDGDEADDEGGDDSTSDHVPSETTSENYRVSLNSLLLPSFSDLPSSVNVPSTNTANRSLSSSSKISKQLRFVCTAGHSKMPDGEISNISSKPSNDKMFEVTCCDESNIGDQINSENNNLGSISAPEVSPSKEFSPLEKFSRSISFHNQLSSPKYENVCFSHPYKDNISSNINKYYSPSNQDESCSCKQTSYCKSVHMSGTSNLEACVDRLSQRQRSVFNITSLSHSPQHVRSARCLNHSTLKLSNSQYATPGNCSAACFPQEISTISNGTAVLAKFPSPDIGTYDKEMMLPVKMLQVKVDDPSKDPNTATEGDIESDLLEEVPKSSVIEKIMIWTERQATFKQVSQVGTSACGATAVINVLLALDYPRHVKAVTAAVKTRLRAENGPLVEYLLSRSTAGASHSDLLHGVESVSEGTISGRFFHMFPKRAFQLSRWLSHWIKKGGVPVATLNLQVGVSPGQTIPDSWHHQMVFGVGPQGIYLTNPLECVSNSLLSDQLCSDSVLLVRRADIESRWDENDKLVELSLQRDPRWNEMNVLGQVVCVLKEQAAPEMLQGRRHLTSHVAIPASYKSGVTIFVRRDNPCKEELFNSSELPYLDE